MTAEKLLSPTILRKLLRYDPETGKLYWRERASDLFNGGKYSAEHSCAIWNSRFANKEAFTGVIKAGYKVGSIFIHKFRAHRVIWALVHGEWPKGQIDHKNGSRDDNRISNLRVVTHSENAKNQKRSSRNTSGVTGVFWDERRGKWRAVIMGNGKNKYLGRFTDFDEAVAVRKAAEAEYGYHPNHGRNAN